jgi:hypothetical protein
MLDHHQQGERPMSHYNETTPFTQDDLEEALDFVGLFDFDVRRGYSGRAMYGRACFGVVHGESDAQIALAIVKAIVNNGVSTDGDAYDAEDAIERACEIVKAARGDNMGRESITYFPGWSLPDGDDDDNDDDEEDGE